MTRRPFRIAAAVFAAATSFCAAQGPLDPVGPPAPTMRTLLQIEPREPISEIPYTITRAGSYYLTRNVMMAYTDTNGIAVLANDVTIDLNGYVMEGPTDEFGEPLAVSGSAIYQRPEYRNLTVRNGGIIKWNDQATEGVGMVRLLGAHNRLQDVSLRFCSRGFELGPGAVVERCGAIEIAATGRSYGFSVADGSVLRDCLATLVYGSTSDGFTTGRGCVLERCVAASNYASSVHSYGFSTGRNSTLSRCIARAHATQGTATGFSLGDACHASGCSAEGTGYGFALNERASAVDCAASSCPTAGFWVVEGGVTLERCTAEGNYDGISAGYGGIVRHCVANKNDNQGINVRDSQNLIQANVCNANGSSGIFVFEDANRIEDNHLFSNDFGLYFRFWAPDNKAERNLAIRNTAGSNSTQNYFPGDGNSIAPIEPAGAPGFTNAWSNFEL